jgi:broad specificity phosphatase PhoE
VIYCSPLRRCRQTLLAAIPGADLRSVRLDDRLMEPQGVAICNRRVELDVLRLQVPAGWCLDGVRALNPFDILAEGRTVSEARVRSFKETELAGLPRGSRVLVVGHHDWIQTWFRLNGGRSVSLGNCEWATDEVR